MYENDLYKYKTIYKILFPNYNISLSIKNLRKNKKVVMVNFLRRMMIYSKKHFSEIKKT